MFKSITADEEGFEAIMYSSNVAESVLTENTHMKQQLVHNY